MNRLEKIVAQLLHPAKGILPADESLNSIRGRLALIDVESTLESRRNYRELLVTTPRLAEWVSGVILHPETLATKASDERPFPKLLSDNDILVGVRADLGVSPLSGHPNEGFTRGLDTLDERLAAYAQDGAVFSKWRADFRIGDGLPSEAGLEANASDLARYAARSLEHGLIPIVEPEVDLSGMCGIADVERSAHQVLAATIGALQRHGVSLALTVLKVGFVMPSRGSTEQPSDEEIAERTITVLRDTVPPAVPGVLFLSGGQPALLATSRLAAVASRGTHPWEVSFSYNRALTERALRVWSGQASNRNAAQRALAHRAWCCARARTGAYTPTDEQQSAG